MFKKKGKRHVLDFADMEEANIAASQAYMKAEIEWAMQVQELMCTSGYPLYQELMCMIQDRNLTSLPTLTAKDIQRAYNLLGSAPEIVQGWMIWKKTRRAIVDDDLVLEEKKNSAAHRYNACRQ